MTSMLSRLVLALLLAFALSACGSDEESDGDATTADGGTSGDKPSLCDDADRIVELAGRVDPSLLMTTSTLGADLKEAQAYFAEQEGPDEVAEEWAQVGGFLGELVEAYGDVGEPTADDVAAGAAALGEDAMARADQALDASQAIVDHVNQACAADGEATASSSSLDADGLCALFSDDDLAAVFGDLPTPEPEPASLGAGYYECEWEIDGESVTDDDFGVKVILMPTDHLQSTYLDTIESTGDVPEFENGHVLKGTMTLTGGGSRGQSVTFSVGDVGGIVGVQKGKRGDRDTEVGLATRFAQQVVAQLT